VTEPGAPRPAFNALLLAGGQGRRAGGPKAARLLGGRPLWQLQAEALRRAGAGQVAAVLPPGLDAGQLAPAWLRPVASRPEAEPFDSLQRGLRALIGTGREEREAGSGSESGSESEPDSGSGGAGWGGGGRPETKGPVLPVLVLPVDCPLPGGEVIAALLAAAREVPTWLVARPCLVTAAGPRHGHPLLVAPAWIPALLAADPARDRLDLLVRALSPPRALAVVVAEPGILANFNLDGWSR
jgi:molybdopterin-guanine dinucleotide biosynthesis protein A